MLERAEIDRWSRDNREGYQRPPLERRLKPRKGSIVRYLLEEAGIFPTSVLLNIREKIEFKEERKISEKISYGTLRIPDNVKLWIIDGQHRIEALKRAEAEKPKFANYPIPVSILNLQSRFDEMLLFYIVNSRQQRIPTVIAYRQLQKMYEQVKIAEQYKWVKEVILGRVQERQAIAAMIVDFLADDETSLFYGRIKYPGEEWEEDRHLVEDEVLIRYISKLLSDKTFEHMEPEEVATLLVDYWSAIKELYPRCFIPMERANYTLLKHNGIAAFTYLFPTVYSISAREASINFNTMKKLLSYLQRDVDSNELDPDFRRPIDELWWSRAHGPSIARAGGEATFNLVAKNMAKKIHILYKSEKKGG
jgi:DGQHR domain-containing protein